MTQLVSLPEAPAPRLRVRILGAFAVERDGREIQRCSAVATFVPDFDVVFPPDRFIAYLQLHEFESRPPLGAIDVLRAVDTTNGARSSSHVRVKLPAEVDLPAQRKWTHRRIRSRRESKRMQSPTDAIAIRKADRSDAESVASVLHEAFAELESLYTPRAFAATALTADAVSARIAEGPVWCALSAGRLAASASAVERHDGLYVRGMAVAPPFRGLGIGRMLLDEIECFAIERRCRRLYLSTTPFLLNAIHLYERFGFRRVGSGPHDLFGTPLFTMEKRLH